MDDFNIIDKLRIDNKQIIVIILEKKMGKFFSKRGLLMAFTLGIFGKNMVWADDCAIFQTAMQTVDKDKYGNMGNCCSTNMVTCENNTITKM